MIEVRLKYRDGGAVEPASHIDWQMLADEFEDGEEIIARLTRPRSNRENRLFHSAIETAWHNQRGGPRFDEEEGGWRKLKAWLLCEAGHCELHEFPPQAISPAVVKVLKDITSSCFWSADRRTGKIRMRRARKITFKDLKSAEFQPVKNAVFEIITSAIVPGITIEQLVGMASAEGNVHA